MQRCFLMLLKIKTIAKITKCNPTARLTDLQSDTVVRKSRNTTTYFKFRHSKTETPGSGTAGEKRVDDVRRGHIEDPGL